MSQPDVFSIEDEEISFEVLTEDPIIPSEDDNEDEQDDDEESLSQPVCVVKPSVSTPISILIESLVKNICMIFENDQKKASAMYKLICDRLYDMNLLGESYTMSEFEGIRSQYQRAFLHLLSSVRNGDKALPIRPLWPKTDINSHYHREFDEMEYIAGGGFGKVYRVKHKLDGTDYAVKKIPIRSEGIQSVRNYLSEVKTFASMNHSNIVQYKGAWLEIGLPTIKKVFNHEENSVIKKSMFHTSTSTNKVNYNKTEYIYHKDITESFSEEKQDDSTDFQIDFEHSVSGASSVRSKPTNSKRTKRKSVSEGDSNITKLDLKEIERIRVINKPKIKWATLYIQMALCQATLKQWLEKRNSVNEPNKAIIPINEQVIRMDTINNILLQLLKGLEYIHSKQVVHHDIKPSNIFIQFENNRILVQLGDFGLACPLQNDRHSLAFGTKLYAAPEQLSGQCNSKSDMYSLGIVLFELVENFGTDMERVHYITDLRKGNIPPTVVTKYPEIAQMISKLVVKNPDDRPDTTTLLNYLKKDDSNQVEQLKQQLAEKEEEILHLKELLKSHGIKSV